MWFDEPGEDRERVGEIPVSTFPLVAAAYHPRALTQADALVRILRDCSVEGRSRDAEIGEPTEHLDQIVAQTSRLYSRCSVRAIGWYGSRTPRMVVRFMRCAVRSADAVSAASSWMEYRRSRSPRSDGREPQLYWGQSIAAAAPSGQRPRRRDRRRRGWPLQVRGVRAQCGRQLDLLIGAESASTPIAAKQRTSRHVG
jgi:hypothetical protein